MLTDNSATDPNVSRALIKLMERYCTSSNRKAKRGTKLLAAVPVILISAAVYLFLGEDMKGWVVVPACIGMAAALVFILQVKGMEHEVHARSSDIVVHDEVLGMIAADPSLCEGFKVEVAQKVREGCTPVYRDLYEIAGGWSRYLAGKKASEAPGAKALQSILNPRNPGNWGLPDDAQFLVKRGTLFGIKTATFDEIIDFIEASGVKIDTNKSEVAQIIAGQPFEVDDAVMQFVRQ